MATHRWKDELERCFGDELTVAMYYGNNRAEVVNTLESGADVLVTSYGTMASDFSKWDDKGRGSATGLFGGALVLHASNSDVVSSSQSSGIELYSTRRIRFATA